MSLREKIQESKDIVKQTMNQVKEMAKEIISAAAKAFRQQIVDNVLDGERKKEYIGWIIEQINKYDTIRLNRYLTKQKPPYFIDMDTTSNIKYKSLGEKLKKAKKMVGGDGQSDRNYGVARLLCHNEACPGSRGNRDTGARTARTPAAERTEEGEKAEEAVQKRPVRRSVERATKGAARRTERDADKAQAA